MKECMDGRDLLAQAIREEKCARVCFDHPLPVYFDEPQCPCCKIQHENRKDLVNNNGRVQRAQHAVAYPADMSRYIANAHRARVRGTRSSP